MAERLGTLDSIFLNVEERHLPMHIGCLLTFETRPESRGRPGIRGIRETVQARLPLLPRCRQRLADVPLGLGRPVWVDDPAFDIHNHFRTVRLPAPGNREQLLALVEKLHARPLDRSRPLWEMHLIEGLADGRTAMYSKLHHAMVDGISALEIGLVLLDIDPDGALAPRIPAPSPAEAPPRRMELLAEAARVTAGDLTKGGRMAMRAMPSLARGALGQVTGGGAADAVRLLRAAPAGPLNGSVGHGRRVGCVRLPLAEIKAVKDRFGASVNDVVLAVIGEAVGHYLDHRGLPRDGLRYRVMVPVSVRSEGDRSMGNQVSAMLVDLPVGPMHPHRRLWAVQGAMSTVKRDGAAGAAEQLLSATSLSPAPFQAALSKAGMINQRVINMVVSNVPGVQMPVYAAGSRTLEMYPLLPLAPNTRLVVCVLSYNNELNIGLVADRTTVGDIQVVEAGIVRGFARLRDGAHGPARRYRAGASRTTDPEPALSRAASMTSRTSTALAGSTGGPARPSRASTTPV